MAYIKYSDIVRDTRGLALPNYRVKVLTSAGAEVNIYADSSGTRFTDGAGGTVNYCVANDKGKAEFYWTPATGQVLQVLDTAGEQVDIDADFADKFVIANLPGEVPQSQVTDLEDDLAAKADDTATTAALATKAATADLASTDSAKGVDLVAGAGKTIATRTAMKALTSAADKARPLTLMEDVPSRLGRMGTFVWDASDLSAEVSGDAQEGIYIPPDSDATGASGAWVRQYGGHPRADWFGALPGNSAAANTTALQGAVDYLLNTDADTLRIPSGKYDYTTLNCLDSGGTARAVRGKIRIVGDGQLSLSDTFGSTTQEYATILNCTSTDGTNGIVMSDGTTTSRRVIVEGVTVIYGGTGYAISCDYCPEAAVRDVSIRITSATGKAMFVQDAWYFLGERIVAMCDTGVTSTVAGVTFDATLFAGNVKFSDCIFNNFNDCFYIAPSANFTNVILDNCGPQKFHRYGVFCEGPIWNLVLRDLYSETGSGTNCVKIAPTSGTVANFRIDGGFFLGGTNTTAWLTGAAVDLANVGQYEMRGIKYRRPWTALVNHGSGVARGSIDGVNVTHDGTANLPAGPLYMLTGTMAKDGTVSLSNKEMTSSSKLDWFDDATHRVAQHDGIATIPNTFSLGAIEEQALNVGNYDWNAADPRATVLLATVTGGGVSAVKLPALSGLKKSNVRIIVSAPSSTQGLVVRTHANTNVGYTISAGEAAICIADPDNSKWMVLPFGAGAYGP